MDSMLSEAGVLASNMVIPWPLNTLTLWEAQFGDCQRPGDHRPVHPPRVKWLRMSGLVLLLPHGYEGQGPILGATGTLFAALREGVCRYATSRRRATTSALRRQVKRNFRKPAVLMSPSLLRHKLCVENWGDAARTRFQRVIRKPTRRVRIAIRSRSVFRKGLLPDARASKRGIRQSPSYGWNSLSLAAAIRATTIGALQERREIIWCQEESANMGCWYFIQPRLFYVTEELGLPVPSYVGRPASASPATGLAKTHAREQAELVDSALIGDVSELKRPFTRPGMK